MNARGAALAGLALAGLLAAPPSGAAEALRLHVWVRAFIPSAHPQLPDYIRRTQKGTWVIEAPIAPPMPSLDVDRLRGTCFQTDNRGFDPSPVASARVTTEFVLVIEGTSARLESPPGRGQTTIGPTENVDCRTGEALQPARKASDGTARVGPVVRDGFDYSVRVTAGSPNPFYTVGGTSIAPDIDYDIAITYNRLYRTLRFDGSAGAFPSLEAYYAVGTGPAGTALQLPPDGDATALSLFDFGLGLNMRRFNPILPLRPR